MVADNSLKLSCGCLLPAMWLSMFLSCLPAHTVDVQLIQTPLHARVSAMFECHVRHAAGQVRWPSPQQQ